MSALKQLLMAMAAVPRLPPEPEIVFRPELLSRSHQLTQVELDAQFTRNRLPRTLILAWSPEVALQRLRGVIWHDEESEHCRTWNGACGCDLGDES